MEFNEKLHELRNQKGLTQQELADLLYVSRTAVSKWESGRGYPNIDSLKAISVLFSITVDELLSGDELLVIAQEDSRQKENRTIDLVFGLLDLFVGMFFFFPFFAQTIDGVLCECSLLTLGSVSSIVKSLYFVSVISIMVCGGLILLLSGRGFVAWEKVKNKISLSVGFLSVVLFILGRQPYAAIFLFVLFAIKSLTLVKWQ